MSEAHQHLAPAARQAYGTDPAEYDAGRPDYPDRIYEVLVGRCGLRPGASVLEIGPGPGTATRRLLAAGAEVTACEPDPALGAYLTETSAGCPLRVVPSTFEEADLPDGHFDLITAATSFHWVDPAIGLTKVAHLVRPGGWVAIWWTIFGDRTRPDPFREAMQLRINEVVRAAQPLPQAAPPPPPDTSGEAEPRPMFELDLERRQQDMREQAGLEEVEGELIRWTCRLDPTQVRRLYGSTIHILRLDPEVRGPLLDEIEQVARDDFGGMVERPFVTSLFTGRRPGRSERGRTAP